MLLQTHTVQGAQDVAVSWNVQKMPLQLSAYHCFRTSTCDTAHDTNNSGYLLQDLVIAHYHPPPPTITTHTLLTHLSDKSWFLKSVSYPSSVIVKKFDIH